MPYMEMIHDVDPGQSLLDAIGNLDEYPLFSANVLVAIYKRPEKTVGGLLIPYSVQDEEKYQGKVGVVVKLGPLAFQDDDSVKFHGQDVKIGDWVIFRGSDTWSLSINKVDCRMMSDVAIRMIVPSPDKVF